MEYLPSPLNLTNQKLICSQSFQFKFWSLETHELNNDFLKCVSDQAKPLIVYISKMFVVKKKLFVRIKES